MRGCKNTRPDPCLSERRISVCYLGDGCIARTSACDMAFAPRTPPTIYVRWSLIKAGFCGGRQKASTFKPAAKPSVSKVSGSGGIGNISSGMRLILRGTSITFITIP